MAVIDDFVRSGDFPVRLSRARFVYLHRREAGSHWLPL